MGAYAKAYDSSHFFVCHSPGSDLLILYPDSLDCGLFRDLVCIPGFRSYFCVSALCTPIAVSSPYFLVFVSMVIVLCVLF